MNAEHQDDMSYDARATPLENRCGADVLHSLTAQEQSILFESVFNSLPVGITVHDDRGQLILANGMAASINALVQTPATSPNHSIYDEKGQRTFDAFRRPLHILGQQLLLSTAVDVTKHKRLDDELARRAFLDELTGLPNRALLQKKVEETLRRKKADGRFALAFIDLDNFKHINDFYNHIIGDALLVAIAQRISKCIRISDTPARISGDEFVLIIDPIDDDHQLSVFINGILDQLKRPFYIEGFEIFTSASIGVSVYPDHGTSYETLRRNADSAMYRVKHKSKGNAAIYDLSIGHDI